MKFLFVTHIFPPATDGGSKIIAKLEKYFSKNGHQTLTLTTPHYSTDDFVSSHSSYKLLVSSYNIIRLPIYHLHRRLSKPIFKFIPFIKFLASSLRFHPNFIIAGPLPTTIVIYARIISKFTHSKLIIIPCFHENDQDFHQKLLTHTLKSADLVCTLTQHEAEYLESKIRCQKSKLFVMHGGVDKNFLTSKVPWLKRSNVPNILFLGNFAAHKGVETLIDAFVILSSSFSRGKAAKPKGVLTLTLAGQKTLYYPKIQQKISSLPPAIKSKINVFPKHYRSNDLKLYLDSSSILVLPSIHESFGLVLIEAMARRIPVIGANIPAVHELITTTKGGLLFTPNDPKDLAKKIEFILNNPTNFQAGYHYVKKHLTWDKIGKDLWQKISSL